MLGLGAAWWAALPYAPSLVIGGAARYLELTAAWDAVLLAGAARAGGRASCSASPRGCGPDWNWLQPLTRVLTNGVALVLVALFLREPTHT